MGRLQGLHESPVMSAAEVSAYLIKRCLTLSAFKSYMFGSYVESDGVDIDILIVGEPGQMLNKLKHELAEAGAQLPLHILFMNPQEAQETNFVLQQHCVSLSQLAEGVNRPVSAFAPVTDCTITNDRKGN